MRTYSLLLASGSENRGAQAPEHALVLKTGTVVYHFSFAWGISTLVVSRPGRGDFVA